MDDFIDLLGASGASYRFRAWADAGQVPMAGNIGVVVKAGGALDLLMLGMTTNLCRAQAHLAAAGLSGTPLFVRLNVAGSTRRLEHDDLFARYSPPQVFDAGLDEAT
jgi:hypothetical protein